MPRIQLEYHIMCSRESSFSHVCHVVRETLQYIECRFSLSAAAVTLPRTQPESLARRVGRGRFLSFSVMVMIGRRTTSHRFPRPDSSRIGGLASM